LQDLKAANTDLNVEIIGVNAQSYLNVTPCISNPLPVVQETYDHPAWTDWGANSYDLHIVDSQGNRIAVYNTLTYDLNYPENREIIRQAFLAAAQITDSDSDQFPDDWEMVYLHNLDTIPTDDSDDDGSNNFTEFAFGTDPTIPALKPDFRPEIKTVDNQKYLSLTFRSRLGSWLNYVVEGSTDLEHWSSSADVITQTETPVNLYDGTGTAQVTYRLTQPLTNSCSFLKVRVVPRPAP